MTDTDAKKAPAGKTGYHHGDLRNALLEAAIDLARDAGPEAVVLRAAARRVGVSPTAAYRHFAGQAELLYAVKERGQDLLADSMEAAVRAVQSPSSDSGSGSGPDSSPASGAASVDGTGRYELEERVRALGRGYLAFARSEPGFYRTAFCHQALPGQRGPEPPEFPPASDGGTFRSFQLVVEVLDSLVAHGVMPPQRRPGAEISAWATVHGLAMLIIDGPLSGLTTEETDAVVEHTLSVVIAGLTAD